MTTATVYNSENSALIANSNFSYLRKNVNYCGATKTRGYCLSSISMLIFTTMLGATIACATGCWNTNMSGLYCQVICQPIVIPVLLVLATITTIALCAMKYHIEGSFF